MSVDYRKAQGATEYLVLLVAVLLLSLVAIGLLQFFPGAAGDSRRAESAAYWGSAARPFAITDSLQNVTTNLSLVLQDLDSEQRILTNISVRSTLTGVNGTLVPNATDRFFSPGDSRTLVVPLSIGATPIDATHPGCTSGKPYEYYVNFTFSNADLSLPNQLQTGIKTLIGTCQ